MTQQDWIDRANAIKNEMDNGDRNRSADAYFDLKDSYWAAIAQSKKTTVGRINPAGFWHAGMSI